jgi:transposase-like protein
MLDFRQSLINSSLRKVLKRLHYPLEVMLTCIRWYVAYPLSLRHVEEMMQERAINLHGVPEKITIDKSDANTAAIESVKADACVDILMRKNKYLNNIVQQDHRAVKRVTQPMLGFKSFWSARILIGGIETMHMIRKGQLNFLKGSTMSAAQQFYSLAV